MQQCCWQPPTAWWLLTVLLALQSARRERWLPHSRRPTHVNCLAPRHYLLSNTLSCLKLTHKRREESLAFILRLIFGCLLIWRNSGGSASLTTILLRGEAIVLWTHL